MLRDVFVKEQQTFQSRHLMSWRVSWHSLPSRREIKLFLGVIQWLWSFLLGSCSLENLSVRILRGQISRQMIQGWATSQAFTTKFPTVLDVELTRFSSSLSLMGNWKKQNSNQSKKSFKSVFKEFVESF